MFKTLGSMLVVLGVLLLSNTGLAAGQGKVDESSSIKSQILAKDIEYAVYLPPDYDISTRHYPIVYLMHGGGDGEFTDWLRFGNIALTLDNMIADGAIPPMIVVTPNGQRDKANQYNTYYMNDADGDYRWEDMFIQEFIPAIEQKYRVIKSKQYRAIAGLSMGGYASLAYSMRHPEMFNAAAALSAAFRTDEQVVTMDDAGYERRYGHAWGIGLKGNDRINDAYRSYSVLDLVTSLPLKDLQQTAFYMDCGTNDDFFIGNAELHMRLKKRGVDHRFMAREGAHNWDYWRSGTEGAFRFLGQQFMK